jgi:hypothetical protein
VSPAFLHPRESSDNPRLNAFCRVAPSLRLRLLATFFAGVLLRAADFNTRTSALVQERRFEFLLAIYGSPNLKTRAYSLVCFQTKGLSNKSLTARARRNRIRNVKAVLDVPLFRDGGPTNYVFFPSRRDQQFQSAKTIR